MTRMFLALAHKIQGPFRTFALSITWYLESPNFRKRGTTKVYLELQEPLLYWTFHTDFGGTDSLKRIVFIQVNMTFKCRPDDSSSWCIRHINVRFDKQSRSDFHIPWPCCIAANFLPELKHSKTIHHETWASFNQSEHLRVVPALFTACAAPLLVQCVCW